MPLGISFKGVVGKFLPQRSSNNNQQDDDLFESTKKSAKTAYDVGKKAVDVGKWLFSFLPGGPFALAALVVGIVLVFMLFMMFFGSPMGILPGGSKPRLPGTSTVPNIEGFSIHLEGPLKIENKDRLRIEYEVTVTYDTSVAKVPIESIDIYDTMPEGVSFVETTGTLKSSSPNQVWSLKDVVNRSPFKIFLEAPADSTFVYTVSAQATGGTSSGGSSPEEFRNLVAGQGRNTNALGPRSNFISTIVSRSSGLPIAGKEANLGQIYDAAISKNVNPVLLTIVWGVESSFATSGNFPFGCLLESATGFSGNVTCAANTLDYWMGVFETQNTNGSLTLPSNIGNNCVYTDPFDYAYEKYTPVCTINHGNDPNRSNFISFYKKFMLSNL